MLSGFAMTNYDFNYDLVFSIDLERSRRWNYVKSPHLRAALPGHSPGRFSSALHPCRSGLNVVSFLFSHNL